MRAQIVAHPVGASVAAAMLTATAWFALASMTGLIFHLMPAGPAIAAAWVLQKAAPTPSTPARVVVVVAGTAIAAASWLLLVAAGRPLDEGWLTLGLLVAGVAVAARLLRRHHPGRAIASTGMDRA